MSISSYPITVAPGEGDNLLINGGFDFFQRTGGVGTTILDDVYGPDRWYALLQTAGCTLTQSPGLTGGVFSARLTQLAATAQRMGFAQIVENVNSLSLRGRTVSFQFNATFNTSSNIRFAVLEWTGAVDAVTSDVILTWTSTTYTPGNFFLASNLVVAGVGSVNGISGTPVACSLSAAISSNCNNLIVVIWSEGALAQFVTMTIGEATLLDGPSVRPWMPRLTAVELALCQRFYCKSFDLTVAPAQNAGTTGVMITCAVGAGAKTNGVNVRYPVPMRAAPTFTTYNPSAANAEARDVPAAVDCVSTNAVFGTTQGCAVRMVGNAATAEGDTLAFHYTASAEL